MYYELYADQNVVYGGAWYDPVAEDFIQVIDMSSADRDERGVNLIHRGGAYITLDNLEPALRSSSHFYEEEPPKPPSGRKDWFAEDFIPPPQPGNLFWMPPPIRGPRILKSWEEWEASQKQRIKFEEMPEEIRNDVLMAAEAILAYHGAEGGYATNVVINRDDRTSLLKNRYPNAIVSSNPEKAIWKILKKMGVRREVES